jgi:hypothetical protein
LHDAVRIEAQGVPAVVVITEPFWRIIDAFAPTIGAPGYRSVVAVPHPVSSKTPAEVQALARSVAVEVGRALIGDEFGS